MTRVVANEYLEWVRRFPLRPIRSERELDQAIAVIDELIGQKKRSREAEDYLDVLSDLVEKYENVHHPIPDATPVEMLQFFIEDRKTNQRAVALGSGIAVSTISEILAGRREVNLEHMQKLARFFNVDVAVFVPRASEAIAKPAPTTTIRRRAAAPRKK